MRPLTNDGWGFASNCFVCEARNPDGLRIPFFVDDDTDTITAAFNLGEAHSGAPAYIHGGVVLAILDEAMAWAGIALGHRWAVTAETATRFDAPVRVGVSHTATARLTSPVNTDTTKITTEAAVHDADGNRCATATATLIVLGEAQAAEATGAGDGDGSAISDGYTR